MPAIQQHVFKAAEIRKAPAKLQNHVAMHSGTEFVCQCDTLKITIIRLPFGHFNF